MLVVRGLEVTPIGAVADERLVAAAQALAQAAQHSRAHLGITLGFGEVAADHVAAVSDPHVLGLQLGVAALAAWDDERHARLGIVEHDLVHLLGIMLAHTQDVFELALLEARDGRIADHAAVGHDADPADGEALTQAVDHRKERGDVGGGVARPHLRAHRPAVLIHDDADHHLVEVRPVVLGMTALAERVAAAALEVQRRGVHEHHGQLAEQVAAARKQPLLDLVLDAARRQRARRLLGLRQLFAQPAHGAIEMMELQLIDAVDAVIVAPMLAGAVGTRHHEAMQHRQEHCTLDRELEPAPGQELLNHGAATALLPQPFEQKCGADAPTRQVRNAAVLDQRQDHRALRQSGRRARQAIEIAAGLDHFLAAEIADDALLGLAVLANGLDQIQVAVGADSLLADEHGISIAPIRNRKSHINEII